MNPIKNRSLLLSVRERPLPVLWLLAFLLPYLCFSFAAIPHFHLNEIGNEIGKSRCHQSSAFHSSQAEYSGSHHAALQLHSMQSSRQSGECFLCDWSASAHGQAGVALHAAAALSSSSEYSALVVSPVLAPAFRLSARGPPLS